MFGSFIPYLNNVMDYSAVNRKVIANNISNFNTPGYKTKSLVSESNFNNHLKLDLRTSDNLHISMRKDNNDLLSGYKEIETTNGKARVDGNNVNQTTEMINMLKNNSLFTKSVNAINKDFSMLKTAIGR